MKTRGTRLAFVLSVLLAVAASVPASPAVAAEVAREASRCDDKERVRLAESRGLRSRLEAGAKSIRLAEAAAIRAATIAGAAAAEHRRRAVWFEEHMNTKEAASERSMAKVSRGLQRRRWEQASLRGGEAFVLEARVREEDRRELVSACR